VFAETYLTLTLKGASEPLEAEPAPITVS